MDIVQSSNRVINSFPPLNNITPFTRVDGWSFLEVLEGLRYYIINTLVSDIDKNNEIISKQLNDWFDQYKLDNAELWQNIEAEKLEWKAFFDQFIEDVTVHLMGLNDESVGRLIGLRDSATGVALDLEIAKLNIKQGVTNYFAGNKAGENNDGEKPTDPTVNGGYELTGIGNQALQKNQRGWKNTAIGFGALQENVDGYMNVAVGNAALERNVGGIGAGTPTGSAPGSRNTAVGSNALRYNTTGRGNVAIGRDASHSSLTGDGNTAVGAYAWTGVVDGEIHSSKSGNWNTAVGFGAGYFNDSDYNVAVGYYALEQAVDKNSYGNVAIGTRALGKAESRENVAVGQNAGQQVTTGRWTIAIGPRAVGALNTGVSGNANIGIGVQAMGNLSGGAYNIGIGQETIASNTTGSRNIVIGHQASMNVGDVVNNTTVLGSGASASHAGAVVLGADSVSQQTSDVTVGSRSFSMKVKDARPVSVDDHGVMWVERGNDGTGYFLRVRFPGGVPITIASDGV